jgi:hypothetical protein
MGRKGRLQEIFSKAIHADNPALYTVAYRDYAEIKEVPLLNFLKISEDFQTIPASRIVYVRRLKEMLYTKSR